MPDGVDAAPDVLGCGYGRWVMLEVLLAEDWQFYGWRFQWDPNSLDFLRIYFHQIRGCDCVTLAVVNLQIW